MAQWYLEVIPGGNIYTMEIDKHYKFIFFFFSESLHIATFFQRPTLGPLTFSPEGIK